eukprot:6461707-Amphidinium_carterae.1
MRLQPSAPAERKKEGVGPDAGDAISLSAVMGHNILILLLENTELLNASDVDAIPPPLNLHH